MKEICLNCVHWVGKDAQIVGYKKCDFIGYTTHRSATCPSFEVLTKQTTDQS
jgi:hypothetical protein